jgi:hypothetical protein
MGEGPVCGKWYISATGRGCSAANFFGFQAAKTRREPEKWELKGLADKKIN